MPLLIATLKRRIMATIKGSSHYLHSNEIFEALGTTEGALQLAVEELEKEGGVSVIRPETGETALILGQGDRHSICTERMQTQQYYAKEILEALYIFEMQADHAEPMIEFDSLKELLPDLHSLSLERGCKKLEMEHAVKVWGAIGKPVVCLRMTPHGRDLAEGTIKDHGVKHHHHQGDVYNFRDIRNSPVAINSAGTSQSVSVQSNVEERELATVLEKIAEITEELQKELPPQQQEIFFRDYENFVKEVSAKNPREKWYHVTGEGLVEAAFAVTTFPAKMAREYKECIELAFTLAKAKLGGQ